MAILFIGLVWPGASYGIDRAEAVKLARQYLASDDDDDRQELADQLAEYDGGVEPILRRLSSRSFKSVPAGYHSGESFSVPNLREKHPEDLLYFTVPKSYRPDRPTGLIVFLHGGGNTTTRRAPRYVMDFPDEGEEEDSYQLGDLFDATGMIAVGPSAPWDEDSSYRWCLEESDEYLADVIAECKTRFNIDADRVVLMGHSMGGFGAYHHAQRQPDRFAAVVVNSGSWSLAYLPMLRGTPLCIVQGVYDARPGERWHYTDIEYARWTDKLLKVYDIDHTYFEHDGEHALSYGKKYIAEFLRSARNLRRDPRYPHVVLASPVGFGRRYCFPVQHNRWLSLDESTDGRLEYDALICDDEVDFDSWRLEHKTRRLPGAAIDAENEGENTIKVKTQNVARFTVWLDARMVDPKKPVTVIVDDETRFKSKVKPSLLTALESYERRGDWGMVYPIKITLSVEQ
jgi:pimeloyl-ACP methyl ester carboxylesterase